MKLYLKSGQIIQLKDLETVNLNDVQYGVGNNYDKDKDDEHIYRQELYHLCSQNMGNIIELYYGDCNVFVTNTSEIVGIEV